ncbi:MAG: sigma-70 domain-containing protein [Lachnospiraceae bacterium]
MLDQNEFIETVELVKQVAESSPEPLSREEILSYFSDMELNAEQKEMIFSFFEEKRAEEEAEAEKEAESEAAVEELQQTQDGEVDEVVEGEGQDSVVYQMYLEELESLPVYSVSEEKRLYEQLSQGDAAAISKLSECWMKRIVEMAKKNQARDVNLQDLIQEGNLALFVTLQELLGDSKTDTYQKRLQDSVETAMKDYISEITGEEDSEATILGKVSLLNHAKNILEDENGRTPTYQELAEYTNMTENEIEDVLALVKEKPGTEKA